MCLEADAVKTNMLRSPVLVIGKATAVSKEETKLSARASLHSRQNILPPTVMLSTHHVAAARHIFVEAST